MKEKLNPIAFGLAAATVSVLAMLLAGLLGYTGMYSGFVSMMQQAHMFFTVSPVGILLGAIEAGIMGFIAGYALGFAYNWFDNNVKTR